MTGGEIAIMLILIALVTLGLGFGVAMLTPPPPVRLLRTPKVYGALVRRCCYCRRADGRRASDGTCAGCGAHDFDGCGDRESQPPRPAPPTLREIR